jgi:hypothetical protein
MLCIPDCVAPFHHLVSSALAWRFLEGHGRARRSTAPDPEGHATTEQTINKTGPEEHRTRRKQPLPTGCMWGLSHTQQEGLDPRSHPVVLLSDLFSVALFRCTDRPGVANLACIVHVSSGGSKPGVARGRVTWRSCG